MVLIGLLLPLILFGLAIDEAVMQTVGKASSVKKILVDSNAYSTIIPAVLEQNKNGALGGENGQGGLNLSDPDVKAAAQRIFTPQFLQQNTEAVIDSVYRWLDGKTPQPDFRIDLSSLKGQFAIEAGRVAQVKAARLPRCSSGLSGSADSFDPFSASCLPPGVTPATVAALVQDNINSGKDFLKDNVITADSLKESCDSSTPKQNCSNKSFFADQLKDVPRAYQKAKQAPLVLAVLAGLFALGMVFLSASRRRGLRRLGIVLLSVGAILLLIGWGVSYGVNQKALNKLDTNNQIQQQTLKPIAKNLSSKFAKSYYTFGGAYAGMGALAILGTIFIGRGRAKPEPAGAAAEEKSSAPAETLKKEPTPGPKPTAEPKKDKPAKSVAKPKPKPTVRKIQIQ